MNDNIALAVLQTFSATASFCSALLLFFSRFHIKRTNRGYETTRWLLFAAMIVLTLHFLSQMCFGFRAQGDDVGALVNILFYLPASYMVSYSVLRMACGPRYRRRHAWVAAVSMLLTVAIFTTGWFVYQSLHMHYALLAMGAVFLLTMVYFTFGPLKEIRAVRRMLENETASDMEHYDLYMRTGTILLFVTSALIPMMIFSSVMLAILCPIFFCVLFFFNISFVVLGFNLSPIAEVIEDLQDKEEVEVALSLDEDMVERIENSLDNWYGMRGFCDPTLNLALLARRLGLDKQLITQYLQERKGMTFRVWLSDLRINEVKRMLKEHEDYCNESIALECGFSSRTWMQQRFKAVTGMTPNEWREKASNNC